MLTPGTFLTPNSQHNGKNQLPHKPFERLDHVADGIVNANPSRLCKRGQNADVMRTRWQQYESDRSLFGIDKLPRLRSLLAAKDLNPGWIGAPALGLCFPPSFGPLATGSTT